MDPITLPEPPLVAKALSEQLSGLIAADIARAGGWISFADFMQQALYAPGLGYYVNGLPKFGATGDFVTAPQLTPLFAQTLAQHLLPTVRVHGQVFEWGAGDGTLARDLLQAFAAHGLFPRYFILEVSPDCQERQAKQLAAFAAQVQWVKAFPDGFCGALVANEVLDAMPVHVFRWQEGQLLERGVRCEGADFSWADRPIQNLRLQAAIDAIEWDDDTKSAYTAEVHLAHLPFLTQIFNAWAHGVAVWIDYGFLQPAYYHAQRTMGTLTCHYQHRAHADPFFYPGLQDITAFVNFSPLIALAQQQGIQSTFYTQAEYLLAHGFLEQAQAAWAECAADVKAQRTLTQAMRQLLEPQEMGERVKVWLCEC